MFERRVNAPGIAADPHPLLRFAAFTTTFSAPLGTLTTPNWLSDFFRLDAAAPLVQDEAVRVAVRDMLRHGGYKPTGRGKPASEYLVRASTEGTLTTINLAVDACNAVSLHSGLPISLVDLDRARPPYRIAIAGEGDRYVFNRSGQEIDLSGLICLFDAEGPCANAVKDSERTKTNESTRHTVSIIWGVVGHEERLGLAVDWYREILEKCDARTELVTG